MVFTEYDAIERRCRANKLGNCGSNLYKLSGPAIREASHCVNAHDEALSRTLLVSGGLGAVLAFRPRRTLSCITNYAKRKNVVARWECILQKSTEERRHALHGRARGDSSGV